MSFKDYINTTRVYFSICKDRDCVLIAIE